MSRLPGQFTFLMIAPAAAGPRTGSPRADMLRRRLSIRQARRLYILHHEAPAARRANQYCLVETQARLRIRALASTPPAEYLRNSRSDDPVHGSVLNSIYPEFRSWPEKWPPSGELCPYL